MLFETFESFDVTLCSTGHYYHDVDFGEAGEHSVMIDPEDLVDEFEKELESVEIATIEVAYSYANDELEMIVLFKAFLKQMTEDTLLNVLSEATE